MPEHTLEELIQLAQPALRHAELIEIAKSESPNKAQEKALSRWPRRQAKAVRFLAMVRRDFGQGAFDALIVSFSEHARSQGPEHARGVSTMSALDSLFPIGMKNVVLSQVVASPFERKHLLMYRTDTDGRGTKTLLSDVCKELKLDEAGEKMLVRRVLDGMLLHWQQDTAPKLFYGQHWAVATFAARSYFPEDKELYKKMLLATVVQYGGHDKHTVSFAQEIIPDSTREMSLQDVINHLLANGCTPDEVRKAWGEMLQMRRKDNFISACVIPWWQGLNVEGKALKAEVEPVARHYLLYELNDLLVQGYYEKHREVGKKSLAEHMAMIDTLIHATDFNWRRHDQDLREKVEEMFVTCIAKGWAYMASYALSMFGDDFNFWSGHTDGSYQKALERLMRGALVKAEELGNFGIASAIAEHLGETAEADRLREVARVQKQKIALKFGFDKPFNHL